jgi:hypothetical protein
MKHKEINDMHPEVIWCREHPGRLVVDINSDGYKRIYVLQDRHDGDDCSSAMKKRYGYKYSYVFDRYEPEADFDLEANSIKIISWMPDANLEFKTIKKYSL